jgi:hypothetical protein
VAGILFRPTTANGINADPPTLSTAVPNWTIGSMIYLGGRTLRVIGRRDDEADQSPALIVEDAP